MDNNLEQKLLHSRTAVLVVDVQNDYCHPEGALAKVGSDVSGVRGMMPNLHRLLAAARRYEVPVIFIQTFHEEATDSAAWKARSNGRSLEVCRTGTWGAGFYEVAPEPGETVVNKHRYSAFVNTRLDSVLRSQKIETLIMTGVSTNVCVESTARDGFMLDYHIVLLSDACASYSKEAHEMTMENIRGYFGDVTESGSVIALWERERKAPEMLLKVAKQR
ncbi:MULTISPECIES: cysteine hydrolase family protein [Paenibacillus]|uniref:Isochorismatase family protein n=1 Tax=Paenibacillus macerans TaxID=44252 RepID=A0A091A4I8_PAEMA|nr:isochorismatase family cysteine hydrolase [Paenibacillus macerans]KFN11201.1 peroxyureidoacrylate/ureidoacrylate amidohydrolase RutB [Paenibacillus macerans]MCY7560267.1 cysteine hydrolase [Paenibacillus macerans]MEC0151321.1 cysteine hydrolase [Paenibacillus macerans]MEC0328836.1 cysteine hydrolase [Paenibacillus macerans]MUG25631.1 isochorismatase family protein [Paenibacillus macerans]